jgi:hypothetical protein
MKLIRNSGNDRVIDRLGDWLTPGSAIDLMSPTFSVYAFAETREFLDKADRCRLLLGDSDALPGALFGGSSDIAFRGKLQGRWLARLAADWIKKGLPRRATCNPTWCRWSGFLRTPASATSG